MARVNGRVILLHSIAMVLTVASFQILSLFFNLKYILFTHQEVPQVNLNFSIEHNLHMLDLYYYVFFLEIAYWAAVITTFLQSFQICRKQGWHWINSLITLAVGFVLSRFLIFMFGMFCFHLKENYLDILIKGGLLLITGLYLLYSNKAKSFIQKSVKVTIQFPMPKIKQHEQK